MISKEQKKELKNMVLIIGIVVLSFLTVIGLHANRYNEDTLELIEVVSIQEIQNFYPFRDLVILRDGRELRTTKESLGQLYENSCNIANYKEVGIYKNNNGILFIQVVK